MNKVVLALVSLLGISLLGGCVTPERKPGGPVSQEDPKPWNRPQQGEGKGMFGGALDRH